MPGCGLSDPQLNILQKAVVGHTNQKRNALAGNRIRTVWMEAKHPNL